MQNEHMVPSLKNRSIIGDSDMQTEIIPQSDRYPDAVTLKSY
jgi:hypothetical protein